MHYGPEVPTPRTNEGGQLPIGASSIVNFEVEAVWAVGALQKSSEGFHQLRQRGARRRDRDLGADYLERRGEEAINNVAENVAIGGRDGQ
eukprot:6207099-Pleurochrysis_carterae.AAC.1